MPRTGRLVSSALVLLLFAVPLAWTKAFVAEFTLAKLLALNACLALAACAWVLEPDALALDFDAADAAVLGALAVVCLCAAASVDPSTSLRGRYDSYAAGLWTRALEAAVFLLAARSLRGREHLAARALAASAAVVAAYGALQRLGFDPILHVKALPEGRAVSMLGSPVDLGGLLALAWPVALWDAERSRRPAALTVAAAVAAGLLACGSRGAWLAAGAATAAYALMTLGESRRGLILSLGLCVLCAVAAAGWSLRPGASPADAARVEVWRAALRAFARQPLAGWGPGAFEAPFRLLRGRAFVDILGGTRLQVYAHNDILETAATLGLLGLGAYASLAAVLLSAARRTLASPARALGASLLCALLARWVDAELNPLALEVAVFACVAGGLLVSLSRPAPPARRALPAALVAAAALGGSMLFALRAACADHDEKLALRAQAAGDLPRAQALSALARQSAPCELSYSVAELNSTGEWINASHDVARRLALLARADACAKDALACHPRQMTAHYAAGMAAYIRAQLGFKDFYPIALKELDEALALDPFFEPVLALRREVAARAALSR